jgi:two-component system phosphate regulon sensor histidine kinase PhoR
VNIIRSYWTYRGYVYFSLNLSTLDFEPFQREKQTAESFSTRFNLNPSILTWILNENQISTLPESSPKTRESSPTNCLLLIPFTTRTRPLGVLAVQIRHNADDLLTMQVLNILKLASGYASTSIENSILCQDLIDKNSRLEEIRTVTSNILESLVNGVLAFNTNHEIIHVNHNASVMFGIQDSDPVGKNYLDALPVPLAELVHLLFEKTLKEEFVMDYQVDYELSGGVILPYGISTSLLKDSKSELLGMTLVARDMTATRELDRLRSLDKLKSDFVSTVSHELRSPLATMKAYIDTLINRVDPDDAENRNLFLKTIETEAERLSCLVNDMLDIARIESGRIQMEFTRMQVNEIIENVGKLCRMQTDRHRIEWEIREGLPRINIDKDRMTQILHNLVNNAVKYSPEGGDIRILAYEDQSAVRIEVSDQGLGIKPEDLKHLFEKFYRVNSQQTSNIGGTGLGLAIVQKLVELHGGKIEVESEFGKGSTFRIILPVR